MQVAARAEFTPGANPPAIGKTEKARRENPLTRLLIQDFVQTKWLREKRWRAAGRNDRPK
jgi:hypothetical protein